MQMVIKESVTWQVNDLRNLQGAATTGRDWSIPMPTGRMARWYRAGVSPTEIARLLKVSPSQVTYDLRELRKRGLDAQVFNFSQAKLLGWTAEGCGGLLDANSTAVLAVRISICRMA